MRGPEDPELRRLWTLADAHSGALTNAQLAEVLLSPYGGRTAAREAASRLLRDGFDRRTRPDIDPTKPEPPFDPEGCA